jgi:ElaB/YqjD/DUF883 family membrane-anchored ribosome-binding protein
VPDDLNDLDEAEAEVDALRDRTQRLVAELERRLRARAERAREAFDKVRHLADLKEQLRQHPLVTIGASTATALVLGLGVYVAARRMLAARRPMARLQARAAAYRALLADPRRMLRPREPVAKRLVQAMLIAGATTIVRSLGALLVRRTVTQRMLPPGALQGGERM